MKRIICVVLMAITCFFGCANQTEVNQTQNQPRKNPEPQEQSPVSLTGRFNENELYDYSRMEADINEIVSFYSEIAKLNIIGVTADGRNLYEILIGDESASEHVIIHGSIHAREYITTRLVMKQTEDFLSKYKSNETFGGKTYSQLVDSVALHIIPMVNPDGVEIAQYGPEAIRNSELRDNIYKMAGSDYDFTQWKANARGVDLNRNFDADWGSYQGASQPSPERYKGTAPASEKESAALLAITEKYPVVRTVSYHTSGEVIYWYFKQQGALKNTSERFANAVSSSTGYPVSSDLTQLDPAGYKDWAISKKSIPSLTVEVGHGKNPVPEEQFSEIWEQNKDVWFALLSDLGASDIQEEAVATILTVYNCEKWISLRVSPSKDADRIVEIPLGATVEFLESSVNGFYKVSYSGNVGYALAMYLK